ncbi:hypothetical protein [Geosporobacter ferrireducens]|uniref:Uncharacterized protein n=1 Tax=Geosporobacter ferrireducens TaxID=1424294 RepID=A0A1D8GGG4_9FIRM|nr:hypothetical protein [Geosporobacter ferrireducens]AOT70012.1 hypothetical protein Gferi_10690 [Geosporobacter ferrireducens]MTI53443.1 hypothetical protein [Geosporobacter ferrireducens]
MENIETMSIHLNMEEIINQMPSVISSKIVMGESQEIEEIHVLASSNRSAKQISRDIQSALTAKFQCKIDHKKISVAQIDFQDEKEQMSRFRIAAIGYSVLGNMAEVKVSLQKGEQQVEGTSKGTNSKNNIYRLTANATLNCVHELFAIDDTFIIEDIEKIQIAKREVIIAAVSFITGYGEEMLVGSAVVRKDEYEAIVKATLDAINRKIVRVAG